MSDEKRSGRVTASITPERIRQALDGGFSVHVVGIDPDYEVELGGRVQDMQEWHAGAVVLFKDETVGGPFYGKRVGLLVRNLTDVRVA